MRAESDDELVILPRKECPWNSEEKCPFSGLFIWRRDPKTSKTAFGRYMSGEKPCIDGLGFKPEFVHVKALKSSQPLQPSPHWMTMGVVVYIKAKLVHREGSSRFRPNFEKLTTVKLSDLMGSSIILYLRQGAHCHLLAGLHLKEAEELIGEVVAILHPEFFGERTPGFIPRYFIKYVHQIAKMGRSSEYRGIKVENHWGPGSTKTVCQSKVLANELNITDLLARFDRESVKTRMPRMERISRKSRIQAALATESTGLKKGPRTGGQDGRKHERAGAARASTSWNRSVDRLCLASS